MDGRRGDGVAVGSTVLAVRERFRALKLGLFGAEELFGSWMTGHSQGSFNREQAEHTGFSRSQAFFLLRQAAHPNRDRVMTGLDLTSTCAIASALLVSSTRRSVCAAVPE